MKVKSTNFQSREWSQQSFSNLFENGTNRQRKVWNREHICYLFFSMEQCSKNAIFFFIPENGPNKVSPISLRLDSQ